MSKGKIIALTALIAFAFAIVGLSNAVAGERVKVWTAKYSTKSHPIEVGDEEGHIVIAYEVAGITKNLEGKSLFDGWAYRETGVVDVNPKTGVGSGHGYGELTDKDGDKVYNTWEGKMIEGFWKGGTWNTIKGTGKFVGIKGSGTWHDNVYVAPKQSHVSWEGEVELP